MSAAGGGATSAVSVLAPNGRRVTVRVGPSTALIQACTFCRFQRTVLDLSLQWRFANLPNNAKLEMVPISRNRVGIENTIRIALQLDDGSRLQDTFSSSQTLWDILHHFAQTREYVEEQSEVSPVCIYMRDEVSGKTALEKTSLKSLGLTGGNAIIRVNTKKAVSSDNAEGGNDQIIVKEVSEGSASTEEPEGVSFPHLPAFPSSSCSSEPTLANQCTDKQNWSKGSQDNSEELRPSLELMPTSFVPFMGSGQCLGGGSPTPTPSPVLTNQPSSLSSPGGPSKPKKSKNSQEKLKEQKEHLEREPIVCHPDLQEPSDSDSQDLPDEFFEVTVDDVRKRLAQLQNERRCLEEVPLMTKAQREAQMKEKLERYPKVVLRVYFPDRHILQGFFHPSETVITPPRSILSDDGMTLFQANLFPAAIVYFGSEVHKDHYLRLDLLETAVSPSEADILVAKRLSKLEDYTTQHLESAPSSSPISNEANQNIVAEHSESTNLEIPQPQIRRTPSGKVGRDEEVVIPAAERCLAWLRSNILIIIFCFQ
ncbi:Tether containing UBX domain for GLUT4, partial [Ophiophagus hannah]